MTDAATTQGPIRLDAPRTRYEPAFDGMRAVTVISIMIFHFGFDQFYEGGVINVDVFFVLSGFLITNLLLDEQHREGRVSFRGFYHRRILRLFPAMYTVIGVYVLFALVIGWSHPSIWGEIVAAALYSYQLFLGFFGFGSPEQPRYLLHLWTLSVEEWFYFFWPLLLIVSLRKIRWQKVLLVGSVLFMAFWMVVRLSGSAAGVDWQGGADAFDALGYGGQVLYRFSTMRFDMLVAGCLLAIVRRRLGEELTHRQARIIGVLAAIGLALFLGESVLAGRVHFFDPFGSLGFNLALLGIPPVVLWVHFHRKSWAVGWLCVPLMVWVGRRSYALYLWHEILNGVVPTAHGKVPLVLRTVLLLALSAGVAELSWRFIESPFLRKKTATYGRGTSGLEADAPKPGPGDAAPS